MRQTPYFALQIRLLNFLTLLRDFWITFILHCLTHAAVLNEHLSLDVMSQCEAPRCDKRPQECGGKYA